MIIYRHLKSISSLALALAFMASAQHAAATDISTVPLNTYSAPSSTDVKPNVLFILDDSGSMNSDFMPDWADMGTDWQSNDWQRRNASYNGIYYNPAVTYKPPIAVGSGGATNTTTYPSMTGTSTATGGSNWSAVKSDAYGVQTINNVSPNTTTNLGSTSNPPYFYTTIAGEYCTSPNLKTCTTASAKTGDYTFPAPLRWCTSSSLTTCGAAYVVDSNNSAYSRLPSPRTATITVAGSTSNSVSDITVGGLQIMSAAATASSTPSSLASNIVTRINACTLTKTGSCAGLGYIASASGSVVTITAPGAISDTPLVTKGGSGNMTFNTTAFTAGAVPGDNLRTTITSTVTSYPYPGSSTKAETRTDCGGTTCTYAEEMTNYANWWTYYRTRMQTMKTSASNAFSTIDSAADIASNVSRFRLGYMSINNNTNSDFLNLGEFSNAQKYDWYRKLTSAQPNNSTPLRATLADAGRLYAGKLNGTTYNGVTVTDPLQYSCQQNYTILSTDGFWNESSGYKKLDGLTDVGNQDAALARPYFDGGSAQIQTRTSTLQSQSITPQWIPSTSTLQSRTVTPQWIPSTSTLQSRTPVPQWIPSTSRLQRNTQLQKITNLLITRTVPLQRSQDNGVTWTNRTSCSPGGTTLCRYDTANTGSWSSPSANTCTVVDQTGSSSTWNGPRVDCQYAGWSSSYVDTNSCTPIEPSSSSPFVAATRCQFSPTQWSNTNSTCTASSTTGCRYAGWTVGSVTGSCTELPQSTASPYAVTTARTCAPTTPLPGSWQTATTTCVDSNNCQYTGWSTGSATGSCTVAAQSSASPYTTLVATTCAPTTPLYGAWQTASVPCTSSGTLECRYSTPTAGAATSSCTALAQSVASPYDVGVATTCASTTAALGTWTPASTCTVSGSSNCRYDTWTGWSNTGACTAVAQSTSPNYTVGTARDCQTLTSGGTSNTLADVAAYYYNTDLRSTVAADGTGTCTGPIISPATTPNDLCANNVPANGDDVATTQHMTTFTLGLGAQGRMIYAPTDGKNYMNDTSGDFYNVKVPSTASSTICTWQSSGTICNWPTPASNSDANIDDLWHAAVNGHGNYFSAKDPVTLAAGLTSTLATIADTPRPGAAAAAASSNPNVSASDNYVFSSSYKSVEWYGELIRQQISGAGSLTAQNWSAMRLLDCATTPWTANTIYIKDAVYRQGTNCYWVGPAGYTSGATFDSSSTGLDLSNSTIVNVDEAAATKVPATAQTSRTIYTKNGTTGLVNFALNALSSAQQAYFSTSYLSAASGGLSQFCVSGGNCLSSADQTSAAGQTLIDFLRGDRSREGTYFRKRVHVLGDIVASEARYVKTPMFNYGDANYNAYKALVGSRTGMVYVGANDGMLHAFNATSGQEAWAYIPEIVLPNLYKLADKNYGTQHQYFVDDTPEVGDMCPNTPASACNASQWRTILVGGLNRGGKGYYALDITVPESPTLLWEFTDANLGYSYGNPRITKLKDGTWVVLLTSGYNSTDGVGRVYVLNANTGALIGTSISTGATADLARLGAHVLTPDTDNTTVAAYGGDTLGNLWRFDINGDIGATGRDAHLLVSLKDASGNAQPITTKPTIASVNGQPIVYVGTGRYLGTSDVIDNSFQAFYAVLDKSNTTTYGNPRVTANGFIHQTLTSGTCPSGSLASVCLPGQVVRTSTSNAVDWSVDNGWYIDFLTGGERSSSDPTLGLGSLLFTTIRPQSSSVSACGAPGADTSASFLYVLNYLTGAAVVGANTVTGVSLGSGLVTRPVMIELSDGSVRALIRLANNTPNGTDMGSTTIRTPPINAPSSASLRRVSWRELTTR